MNITTIVTGSFQENCYIIANDQLDAIIIDPGFDADKIAAEIHAQKLNIVAYVCTHGHTDHVNALAKMHEQFPAPIAMHSMDWKWAFTQGNELAPYYAPPLAPSQEPIFLDSNLTWDFGSIHFEIIETPGHTPGSTCIYFKDDAILIAGDTLFKGSCGRTDLPGGNPRDLKDSLKKLRQLPDNVTVYPGHGDPTTIGDEKATNFFMQ